MKSVKPTLVCYNKFTYCCHIFLFFSKSQENPLKLSTRNNATSEPCKLVFVLWDKFRLSGYFKYLKKESIYRMVPGVDNLFNLFCRGDISVVEGYRSTSHETLIIVALPEITVCLKPHN